MTAQQQLRRAIKELQTAGCEAPRLDAELLLMHVWGVSRTQLITQAYEKLPSTVSHAFHSVISKRCKRIPIAYITETKEFWSRNFKVSPDVLIPRPETEHLIEELLKLYPNTEGCYHFADIGTGSGCIAVTLAAEYPNATIIATDICEASLHIAQNNAQTHHVAKRIQFRCGHLYQAFDTSIPKLDAIISNPPYVAQHEMAELADELHHEPVHALTDQSNGLSLLRTLLQQAPNHLKRYGHLLLETGLCGLPETPNDMRILHPYHDLAGLLRGGIYQFVSQNKGSKIRGQSPLEGRPRRD
ncbi:MAG: peptide chain release factor N(5)-glutamine methyltransferase [Mariprofundaceae bacterium]|nr:peptide chain release factor N(5)-glutamine methyltransferase [Mariprofundaceae bacterium]